MGAMHHRSRQAPLCALFLLAALLGACGAPTASAPGSDPTPVLFELPTVTPDRAAPQPAIGAASVPTPIIAEAQPVSAPALSDTARTIQLDTYMTGLANGGAFQGVVWVARQGEVVLAKGYGVADGTLPATPQTRYRLASLTKQFTAAGIMLLQQQGKLNVQDPVCQYLDECPAAWQPIRLHHLLSHTSGLPNYTDFYGFEATESVPTTPEQLVARFRDMPLNFTPGSLYSYGNSGYLLLGLVIERVSDQSYTDFVSDTIFAPLGMHNSGVDTGVGAVAPGIAPGFDAIGRRSGFLDASTLFASGNLYASAEDMARWNAALGDDRLLNEASRTQMQMPNLLGYGYGLKIEQLDGRRMISHPGMMTGASTFAARFPDDGVVVIVLSNVVSTDTIGIGYQLARLMFGP
jgi:CubicO group peptidase (beta-lactamase class C family)